MRTILIALSLVAISACNPEPPAPPVPGAMDLGDQVLVTVNGHPVTQKLVDVGIRPLPQDRREALLKDDNRRRDMVERLAFAELLYQRALTEKLPEDPEVKDSIALAQREILANIMLERIGKQAVTDATVQEKYDSMAVQFNRPSAKVQHILVDRQDLANQIVEQIKSGQVDFLAAAKEHSIDRGIQEHGGDLGWTMRAPIRELQEAWESAPVGDIVGPVEGRLGFHIFKVLDRRDKTPLEEVRPQLEEMLKVEAMQAARGDLMREAKLEWVDKTLESVTPPAAEGANAGGMPPMPPGEGN